MIRWEDGQCWRSSCAARPVRAQDHHCSNNYHPEKQDMSAYPEMFWAFVGTTGPIIALANVVTFGQATDAVVRLRDEDRKAILEHEEKRAKKRIFRILRLGHIYFVSVCFALSVVLTMLAAFALWRHENSLAVPGVIALLIITFALLFILGACSASFSRRLADLEESQLWEKKAATYEKAIARVRYRREQRSRQLETSPVSGPKSPDESPVNWAELLGQLFAYASPGVLTALTAANDADLETRARYREWQEMATQEVDANAAGGSGHRADITETPTVIDAAQALALAIQAADDKDDVLIAAIHADLALKPVRRHGQVTAKGTRWPA
jgi:hypothetical protein